MNETFKGIGLVIAGVIVGVLFSVVMGGNNLGGVYSNVIQDFSQGVTVDGTVVIDGNGNIDAPITSTTGTFSSTLSVTGATTLGGDLTVTTTNTATSSLSVGCVQINPTSTASVAHMSFSLGSTTSTTEGVTSDGLVAWSFGACPI